MQPTTMGTAERLDHAMGVGTPKVTNMKQDLIRCSNCKDLTNQYEHYKVVYWGLYCFQCLGWI